VTAAGLKLALLYLVSDAVAVGKAAPFVMVMVGTFAPSDMDSSP